MAHPSLQPASDAVWHPLTPIGPGLSIMLPYLTTVPEWNAIAALPQILLCQFLSTLLGKIFPLHLAAA